MAKMPENDYFIAAIKLKPFGKFGQLESGKGGRIIEGFISISIINDLCSGKIYINLTSGDVNYQRSQGRICLDDIEYIEMLNPVLISDLSHEESKY